MNLTVRELKDSIIRYGNDISADGGRGDGRRKPLAPWHNRVPHTEIIYYVSVCCLPIFF